MTSRRPRYERATPRGAFTGSDMEAVVAVAQLGIANLAHVAGFLDWTPRKASNHLRNAYDWKYLDKQGLYKNQTDHEGHKRPLGGSEKDLYLLTAFGRKQVERLLTGSQIVQPREIDTKSVLVSHMLMVRDVRIWLTRVARHKGHPGIQEWREEETAAVEIGGKYKKLVPDGYLRYMLPSTQFGLFLEADTGTMRFREKWVEKVEKYLPLLLETGEGSLVQEVTGLPQARLLVATPTPTRRDSLAELIDGVASYYKMQDKRILVGSSEVLKVLDPSLPLWRANGTTELVPLIRSELL